MFSKKPQYVVAALALAALVGFGPMAWATIGAVNNPGLSGDGLGERGSSLQDGLGENWASTGELADTHSESTASGFAPDQWEQMLLPRR